MAALPGRTHVLPTAEATVIALGDWLASAGANHVADRGAFHLALAGGTTPTLLYAHLAQAPLRDRIAWGHWWLWFGDERAVPPDDPASNQGLVRRTLVDALVQRPAAVMGMDAARPDLDAAAAEYAALLAQHLPPGPSSAPRLDCILLGLGENGHTASLFPGDPSVDVVDRWAVRSRADYAPFDRITLTFPTLNAARTVTFLVTGRGKGPALAAVRAGTVPAARVLPHDGELHWFLDEAAASTLP